MAGGCPKNDIGEVVIQSSTDGMAATWAAEPVGNQRGAFINIHRLVLFGQGLWSQEPIVPGHTEQRVLLRRAMDVCCPHLDNIRACSEKTGSASFALKSRAIAHPAFSGIWDFRKVSAVARLPAWTRRARLTSTSHKDRQPLLFRDRCDNHIFRKNWRHKTQSEVRNKLEMPVCECLHSVVVLNEVIS